MRQLASVQQISEILPHPNADSLEIAKVLGWRVVVKKGEFKQFDRCVYIEIDSILPARPEFEFMRPRNFRVKTIKLRGEVSQGICFPLSILPEPTDCGWWKEGDDVTEVLGVIKYDREIAMNNGAGFVRRFPDFIVKTDETRIQSMPGLLRDYAGELCYVTEKLDGSSFTAYVKDGQLGFCSRNMEIQAVPENDGNVFYEMVKQYGLFDKFNKFFEGLAIQGEVIGPKIQGNRYGLKRPELRLFSVWNIADQRYLNLDRVMGLAEAFGIPTVPVLDTHFVLPSTVDELVAYSNAPSVLNKAIPREGVVIRSWRYIANPCRELREFSFKVINPEFLLKYE